MRVYAVCDGSFFPSLLNEMSAVVGCFNEKAKKLLELHLASSGFRKYTMWFTSKQGDKSHGRLIQRGKDLVTYAIINAVAMRKILKKYDKACMIFSTRPSCLLIISTPTRENDSTLILLNIYSSTVMIQKG